MAFSYDWYHRSYLRSAWWKQERVPAFWANHDKKCECCWTRYQPKRWLLGKPIYVVVHHKDYSNIGHEPDDDLMAVCTRCHRTIHQIERSGRFRTLREASDYWKRKRSRQAERSANREARKLSKKLAKS